MIKKEYKKPSAEVYQISTNQQLLAGSIESLVINGMDDETENLVLGEEEINIFDYAW